MKSKICLFFLAITMFLLTTGCGPSAPPTSTLSINNLSPQCGVAGIPVTITGSGFGATQGESKVFFGTVEAAVQSWSSTQIRVTVPSAAVTGDVTVQVAGETSNPIRFTIPCVDQPSQQTHQDLPTTQAVI